MSNLNERMLAAETAARPMAANAVALSGQGPTMTIAAEDVLAERRRQMTVEGWTPEHDDNHKDGSLALAAACYASMAAAYFETGAKVKDEDYAHIQCGFNWPRSWSRKYWKPKNARRDLVRAAAMIIAEIERIDRAATKVRP